MTAIPKNQQEIPSETSTTFGALVRIGASTAGCAALGGAMGSFFGLTLNGGTLLLLGGLIGLMAAIADNIKFSKSNG